MLCPKKRGGWILNGSQITVLHKCSLNGKTLMITKMYFSSTPVLISCLFQFYSCSAIYNKIISSRQTLFQKTESFCYCFLYWKQVALTLFNGFFGVVRKSIANVFVSEKAVKLTFISTFGSGIINSWDVIHSFIVQCKIYALLVCRFSFCKTTQWA